MKFVSSFMQSGIIIVQSLSLVNIITRFVLFQAIFDISTLLSDISLDTGLFLWIL